MKILVVDNNKAIRMNVDDYVSALGYDVYHAETGKQCLEFVKENDVDLILMDIDMPDLNGFVATKIIRSMKNEDWFPIVFLTTRPDNESYINGILAGGDGYLQKPINQTQLQLQLNAMERICVMRRKIESHKDLISANLRLSNLAMFDQLTGLANRRHFDETFNKEFNLAKRDKTPLSLLLCDIDFFKLYNDKYGHQEGDECLKQVATAIQEVPTRPTDLTCRYGGEEFVVILPRTCSMGAIKIADRIRQSVYARNLTHSASKVDDRVTVSLGLASYNGQYKTMEEFIKDADKALYKAKEKGRNRFEMV
ncbi:MAG: GGDEF domain-containing response regulator [Methylococcaceae bacterium]